MSLLERFYRRIRSAPRRSSNVHLSRLYLRNRNRVRGEFHFVTLAEASIWTTDWIRAFPQRYDLVVGVPRSGLAIASIVALKLGLPLSTPDHCIEGKWWFSEEGEARSPQGRPVRILLVDDSVSSGRTMEQAVAALEGCSFPIEVTRAALITSPESEGRVDLWYRNVPRPRFFEWNILHRKISTFFGDDAMALRLEGVLCALSGSETGAKGQGGPSLGDAHPFLIPAFHVETVFTAWPESQRAETEAWLLANDVRYGTLVMDCTEPDRLILERKPGIVWESDLERAEAMFGATSVPTLSIDEMVLLS